MREAADTSIDPQERSFVEFMAGAEPRLRRTLVSLYGPEVGREGAAEALAYGWQHWDRVSRMNNPTGYLFRVGQTWVKRQRRRASFPPEALVDDVPDEAEEPSTEPGLAGALRALSVRQRTAVLLVKGFDCTYEEVSELMGIRRSSVQKHVERGLVKLRHRLGVHNAG